MIATPVPPCPTSRSWSWLASCHIFEHDERRQADETLTQPQRLLRSAEFTRAQSKQANDRYDQAMSQGRSPDALDKEYIRLWLGEQGYKGDGTPPEIPDNVRCEAARRYIEAFEQVTGRGFEPNTEEPIARIRRNLGLS